jgi:hypothetical protein
VNEEARSRQNEDVLQRLFTRVEFTESCWLWRGSVSGDGYGGIRVSGRNQRVHRVAYELLVAPVPDGLVLDHLCRVRNCVRPDHLEPVTGRVNTLRGETITAKALAATHCPQGHPYAGENLLARRKGWRGCRQCALSEIQCVCGVVLSRKNLARHIKEVRGHQEVAA